MKGSRLHKPHDDESKAKIVAGRLWHLPTVFSQLQVAAQDGFFSASLVAMEKQFPLLLVMLGIVLFGRIKLPGMPLRRAQLRVAEIDGEVVGHTFLVWQGGGLEVATCAVNETYRRSGIGQTLIKDAVKIAEDLPVDAYCLPKSHAMCMLLRGLGFIAKVRSMPGPTAKVVVQHWQFSPASQFLNMTSATRS